MAVFLLSLKLKKLGFKFHLGCDCSGAKTNSFEPIPIAIFMKQNACWRFKAIQMLLVPNVPLLRRVGTFHRWENFSPKWLTDFGAASPRHHVQHRRHSGIFLVFLPNISLWGVQNLKLRKVWHRKWKKCTKFPWCPPLWSKHGVPKSNWLCRGPPRR